MQLIASGTQLAVISTEHVLATVTTPGVYFLWIDHTNLAGGDAVAYRAKVKVLSSGSYGTAWDWTFSGAQGEFSVFYGDALPIYTALQFTLKQTAGVGRNFTYQVLRVDIS